MRKVQPPQSLIVEWEHVPEPDQQEMLKRAIRLILRDPGEKAETE